MASKSKYQYEPLITPSKWNDEEKRFARRLTSILDDLHAKVGRLKNGGSSSEGGSSSALDAYPVGSIYMSVNETSPEELFGGSWVRIQSRFLLAAGDGYSAGSEGGEASHQLTASELPSISGTINASSNGNTWGVFSAASGAFSKGTNDLPSSTASGASSSAQRASTVTMSFGGNQSHNNMPPYLAVFMWKRTA